MDSQSPWLITDHGNNFKREGRLMPTDVLNKPATIDDVRREVSKIKSIVTDAVEDGIKSATKAIKHGRDAAEDVLDEAEHAIKKRPFEAIGVFFAAGVVTGGILTWIGFRRR
jgi:ElaB/YqjD/DUF883 family membrane-anchored ribosome-binding protein